MSQTSQPELQPDLSPTVTATPLGSLADPALLAPFAGVLTARVYTGADGELQALHSGASVFDAGWLSRLRITGSDRVRWLNGMVTNTVKDLAAGRLNYTFLLNAQGRIQGDGEVYALPAALLFATERLQAERLREHLDRFIIMDEVELAPEPEVTAIGLAGPRASEVLARAQLPELAPNFFSEQAQQAEQSGTLLARHEGDRYTLWVAKDEAADWWNRLQTAGATPCGMEAVEALRVLSGIPRFGVDMHDKSLAQETGQGRALHFNKGCYLGQEIVERIRSRATVHRGLRVLSLDGATPEPGTPLFAAGKPDNAVGELTSVAHAELPEARGVFALGTMRTEAAAGSFLYDGGTATVLARPPLHFT